VIICSALTGSVAPIKDYVPTPMPTSTIRPREISDTVSLFTAVPQGFQRGERNDIQVEKETCDRRREHTLDYCPHALLFPRWVRKAVYSQPPTVMAQVKPAAGLCHVLCGPYGQTTRGLCPVSLIRPLPFVVSCYHNKDQSILTPATTTEGLHKGSAHDVADKLDSDKRPSACEGERKEKTRDKPNHQVN